MIDSNEFNKSLKTRKSIYVSVFALTIFLISYLFLIGYFLNKQNTDSSRKQISILAGQLKDLTASYLNSYVSNFIVLSKLQVIKEKDSTKLNELFVALNQEFPEFENIAVVDEQGNFFGSGQPFDISKPPNVSNLNFFKKLANNDAKFFIMEAHLGPISKQEVSGIVVRLEGINQEFKGALGTSIKLSHLTNIWVSFAEKHNLKLISYKGSGNLVFSHGIGDPDITKLLSKLTSVQKDNAEIDPFFYTTVLIPGLSLNVALLSEKPSFSFGSIFSNYINIIILVVYLVIVSVLLFFNKKENYWIKTLVQKEKELRKHRDHLNDLVTERTAELADAKANLDSIFDSVIPVSVTNFDYEIIHANSAYQKAFRNKSAVSMKCYDSRKGHCCKTGNCPIQQIKNGAIQVNYEASESYEDFDKEYLINVKPYTGRNGELLGIVETFQDITELKRAEEKQAQLVKELQIAVAEVKTLHGILPICMHCKKIRDDDGSWNEIEQYIAEHSDASWSHGICNECVEKHYPHEHKAIRIKKETP